MGEFPRKADGRRVFTTEFKRQVVQQIQKGEKALAELSRELDIYPTVIRTWKRRYEAGASTASESPTLSALTWDHAALPATTRRTNPRKDDDHVHFKGSIHGAVSD
jgi:transposase-like protein